jgi:hypothetical protein
MKRQSIVKLFSGYLKNNDLAIFAGNNICREAYLYDRPGNFYVEDETGIGISLALGMAMCTDKRVFIFCDDYYFLKRLGSSIHIALSKCRNIFLVVLASGEYQYSGHNPTIFNEINAVKTMMFGAGFIINDYTKHFNDVHRDKIVKNMLNNLYGPLFVVIYVDLGENKKAGKVDLTVVEKVKRLTTFLSTKGTSLYMPQDINFSFKGEAKE